MRTIGVDTTAMVRYDGTISPTERTEMTTTYEYRTDHSPQAMPYGTATISAHDSAEAAFDAWDWESTLLHQQAGMERSWLARVVIRVDPDGTETIVRRTDFELAQCGMRLDDDGELVPLEDAQ